MGGGKTAKRYSFAVVELVMVGGPSNFIVNQSPNLWIFGWSLEFKTFYLSLKAGGGGWVVSLVILMSTKVQIFGFLD